MKDKMSDLDTITERENIIFSKLHFIFVFISIFIVVPVITLSLVAFLNFLIVCPVYYLSKLFS